MRQIFGWVPVFSCDLPQHEKNDRFERTFDKITRPCDVYFYLNEEREKNLFGV